MDTEKVYTTSLRLYKSRPVHHQAYRYLKEYNKDIFKTKDDFIAEAIVYFAKYLQQEEEVQQMSDMELREDYQNNILVLGMLSDGPLEKFLKDYPHIRKIQFCLDNDLPGRQAAKKLARKYTLMEYEVFVRLPPMGKDYNAFLQYKKENQELSSLVEKERPLFTETKGTNIQKIEKMVGHRNIVPYQIAQAR